MDKRILARNFSRCAHVYDNYANIQSIAAVELISELSKRDFGRILEIGCGTGIYTKLLRERFMRADISSVDIAEKMVEAAREKLKGSKIRFTVQDAEEIVPDGVYDLVTSNAAIQWFGSIEAAVKTFRNILRDGGALTFSVFGPLTFRELETALKKVHPSGGISVASGSFSGKAALERILLKHLGEVSVREVIVEEEYISLSKLLEKIKYTGVSGSGLARASGESFVWSRRLLKIVEEAYEKEFGRIFATYQVFLCKALR